MSSAGKNKTFGLQSLVTATKPQNASEKGNGNSSKSSENVVRQDESRPVEGPAAQQSSPKLGAHAYFRVLGGFLLYFNIWGFPISYGAFQTYYQLDYLPGSSASAVSWVGSVQGFLLIAMGLLTGPLHDLGYTPALLCVGALLSTSGMMMLSLSTRYYQVFLAQGVCVGLGFGMLYIPTLAVVTGTFPKTSQRAAAMGIVTSGIALGGVVYTLVFDALIYSVGFGWTTRILGFMSLTTFVFAVPALLSGPRKAKRQARSFWDPTVVKDLPFLCWTAAQFFIFFGYNVPLFYVPVYARVVLHTSNALALHLLVILQAASFFGRLVAGAMASRVGSMLPWVICCSTAGIMCLCWMAMDSLGSFIAFCIVYGFVTGGLVALPASSFISICPDPAMIGTRMGIAWTLAGVSSLVGSPVASAISDLGAANFIGIQAWGGSMLLFGCMLLVVLWTLLVRKQQGKILI
ncbi:MAG: hypothetical protein M1828_000635 [Chrysothrix sp. TS-e1954]|nr:MAG: hypothetical protein M1828_000635 [Chrysothrix sp. TS-e1954]